MKWKPLKSGVAVMLAAALVMPILPAKAEDALSAESIAAYEALAVQTDTSAAVPEGTPVTLENLTVDLGISNDQVIYNTGSGDVTIAHSSISANDSIYADDYFAEDGSYTIQTELNAFFPYEVQFCYNGEVTRQWFMSPDSSVEIGGHTFYVDAPVDGTGVTQMSLEVGGDTITVYPEEKEFPEGAAITPFSLLPIKEVTLRPVDLTAYTPVQLTQVSVKTLLGDKLADGDMVVWKSSYSSRDEYTVSQSGDIIDLSVNTYYNSSQRWEIIVGSGDQLDADAVRYQLPVNITESRNWLVPTVYFQDEQGVRKGLQTIEEDTRFYDYERDERRMYVYVGTSDVGNIRNAYVSLSVNPNVFAGNYHLRAFEGNHSSAAEAMAAKEITDQIFCGDMAQPNTGYLVQRYTYSGITVVSFDDNGNVTGCLPLSLYLGTMGYSLDYSFQMKNVNGSMSSAWNSSSSTTIDGCTYQTYTLRNGLAANGTYFQSFTLNKDGVESPDLVTGAYIGLYSSLAEATAAGAVDIKAELFGKEGYAADYSNGVYMTIIVGADGSSEQIIWKYCIKVEEGSASSGSGLGSGALVNFNGFKTEDGTYISCYQVDDSDESYGEYNYLTVMVGKEVTDAQLANLAPTFSVSYGAKLYAAGSSTEEVSGESFHDFRNVVQYTVSAEDGENARNYWVHVVRASDGAGQLYINSLTDPDAETQVRDGVIYSTREVMLDGYHYNIHDILFSNMGTEPIEKLSVELVSDTVELHDYWTLKGEEDLLGFEGTTGYQPAADGSQGSYSGYGELWNLAKVRLTAKAGVASGTDVSGTLTVKSDGVVLMVLTLTGTVGNPSITTTDIPQAVQYVPYGTMIQNSNKYSWNKVTYELYNGELPSGMIVKPNGEIYGVPTEAGEFTFTVRMRNSYGSFGYSDKTYTMVVNENTDENVDNATDSGYDLTQRVQYAYDAGAGDQLLVSQGVYAEFQDLYLDGVKLTDGVDYTSESGSTRITIYAQTLTNGLAEGTHTLGIEFRTRDTDTLKRAAQNYVIGNSGSDDNQGGDEDNSGSGDNGSDNGDGDSNGDNGSDNGGSSNGSGGNTADQTGAVSGEHVKYTVVKGDTLSKIAKNNGVSLAQLLTWNSQIKNPNLILPGQIITVGYIQGVNAAASSSLEGAVYDEVKVGDCLIKIARRNGITLSAVIALNPDLAKQKYIYPSQKVRVK